MLIRLENMIMPLYICEKVHNETNKIENKLAELKAEIKNKLAELKAEKRKLQN